MAKMRVYELARELALESKDLIEQAHNLGIRGEDRLIEYRGERCRPDPPGHHGSHVARHRARARAGAGTGTRVRTRGRARGQVGLGSGQSFRGRGR